MGAKKEVGLGLDDSFRGSCKFLSLHHRILKRVAPTP